MAKTLPMTERKTLAMGMAEGLRTLLQSDEIFKGANDSYEIFSDKIIGIGGEAIVYEAKRESDGTKVVAKIYDGYSARDIANRKSVLKFLKANTDYSKTHVVPLLDEGTILIRDDEGGEILLHLDIIPLMETGGSVPLKYDTLRKEIIPGLLSALNTIHAAALVHRDIKPENIYFYNGEIVIADFGTAGVINAESGFGMHTSTKRGTIGYTAPELDSNEYVFASDYYSLGCTIATLYKGRHVYQTLLDTNDGFAVKQSIRNKGLVLDCPTDEEDLQMLVNALVKTDYNDRAAYDDVALWLNDKAAFVAKWRGKHRQEDDRLLGFNFDGVICNDEMELTGNILEKWEDAKRYLYRNIFADFYKQKNPALADKIMDIVESRETANNLDLGMARFLHILNDSSCPIYWQGKAYDKLSDIAEQINNSETDADSITIMLKDGFLSWKLKNNQEGINQETIDAIAEIEELTTMFPQLGYYAFMFRFAANSEKNSNDVTDKEFGKLIEGGHNWHASAETTLKSDRTFANIYCVGFKNNVIETKNAIASTDKFFSHTDKSQVLLVYQLFDGVCEDKAKVREHYLKYGPLAYLYWFQQNLNLYSFNSPAAKDIERKIKGVEISKKMSIGEIYKALLSLSQYAQDFLALFQNNYLLTYLGLNTEQDKSGITTEYTHAFWNGEYYSTIVPVGYMKASGR
jgi:serine/threonine protein kinase